jgi:molybdenum cofactor biosynthesis enzyme MoaA
MKRRQNRYMENTDYCQSFNKDNGIRTINILGKEVKVKGYICSADGVNYPEKPDDTQLQLSVLTTSFCPANCAFCIAKGTKEVNKIDVDTFSLVMRKLKEENVVRGVKITGGEPFTDIKLLNEVVNILFDVFGLELELSISTNGMGLMKMHEIDKLSYLETIHLSRHHYDDNINKKIFGNDSVPDTKELKEIVDSVKYKDLFVMNCMLLKDYINSPKEAHKFLDYAIEINVPKVAFMSCTPVNEYAKSQTIPYETALKEGDETLLFTRGFNDYDFCRCRDGVYVSEDGRIVEFYGRSTNAFSCDYCRSLVYDTDNHLKVGFSDTIIF